MQRKTPVFETVVFSGGGNRCFWQAGFWEVVSAELGFKPKRILAVSGGAYVSCGLFGQVMKRLLNIASTEFGNNKRNFYPLMAVRGKRPFPHPPIYRKTLGHSIDDEAFERLRKSPPIFVQTASPPKCFPLGVSLGLAIAGYYLEKCARDVVHSKLNKCMGFKPRWLSTHECSDPKKVIDLICASSCVPPFFPVMKMNGAVALDGGFVENSPVELGREVNMGRTLVLLTRRYKSLPKHRSRLYWYPQEEIPVKNFDTTASQGIRVAFQRGRDDGIDFVQRWDAIASGLQQMESA